MLLVLLVWGTLRYLDIYSMHGETITVPDLRGLTLDQVDIYLSKKQLEYVVKDSTYVIDALPSTVLDQVPKPNSKVKEYRKIYLTVNATQAPKVKMPNLIDKSLRQASMEIETWGLKVGDLSYRPNLAQNAVLEQKYLDSIIEPGTLLPKGSSIDLVLGDGFGNTKVEAPSLLGLTLEECKWSLVASSLNIGAIIYDETVEDSTTARIYKQIPTTSEENPVLLNMGESIDVFLTQELSDSLIRAITDTFNQEQFIDDTIDNE